MKTFFNETFCIRHASVQVVNCLHIRQNTTLVPHSHEFVEFTAVKSGQAVHHVWLPDGRGLTYPLSVGSIFMVAHGETHTFELSGEPLSVANVLIESSILHRIPARTVGDAVLYCLPECAADRRYPVVPVTDAAAFAEMKEQITRLDAVAARTDAAAEEERLLRLMLLLHLAAQHGGVPENRRYAGSPEMLRLIGELQQHCCDGRVPSLAEMAEQTGYSVRSFTARFRAITGESVGEFVHRSRVEKARYLLSHTDLRIGEIALSTGFEELPYFNRVFRRLTGMTPTDYRRQNAEKSPKDIAFARK